MNNQLNWNQENNLREQITALTGEIDGSIIGMPVETVSNGNSKGKKDNGNKVAKPEELILRPGEGSLAFANSLDLPYNLHNTAEELYRDIRQDGTPLEVYAENL